MMVIQCLMVVMQSGWQAPRITSPIPTAAFTSTLFSSTFFMNSWKARRNWFVALTPLGFAWAGCFGAPRYLVGVDEGLQGLGVVRQRSPKAQGLLGFREPLQQRVHSCPELLSLQQQEHRLSSALFLPKRAAGFTPGSCSDNGAERGLKNT